MAIIDRAPGNHEGQTAILERIATSAPLPGTLDALISHLESQIPGSIGALLLVEPDGRRLGSASGRGLPAAFRAAVDGLAIGPLQGSCGAAAYRREPVYAVDIAIDALWAEHKELARSHGLRACWSTPILSRRRPDRAALLGTLAGYFRAPTAPEPHHPHALA